MTLGLLHRFPSTWTSSTFLVEEGVECLAWERWAATTAGRGSVQEPAKGLPSRRHPRNAQLGAKGVAGLPRYQAARRRPGSG